MFDQFKAMKDLTSMLGNMGELREKAEQFKAEMARKTAEADAGAGAVRVTVNGAMEVVSVTLDPAMIGALAGEGSEADKAVIEDLIVAATNEALARMRDIMAQEMSKLTGGMNLPGMENLLG